MTIQLVILHRPDLKFGLNEQEGKINQLKPITHIKNIEKQTS